MNKGTVSKDGPEQTGRTTLETATDGHHAPGRGARIEFRLGGRRDLSWALRSKADRPVPLTRTGTAHVTLVRSFVGCAGGREPRERVPRPRIRWRLRFPAALSAAPCDHLTRCLASPRRRHRRRPGRLRARCRVAPRRVPRDGGVRPIRSVARPGSISAPRGAGCRPRGGRAGRGAARARRFRRRPRLGRRRAGGGGGGGCGHDCPARQRLLGPRRAGAGDQAGRHRDCAAPGDDLFRHARRPRPHPRHVLRGHGG